MRRVPIYQQLLDQEVTANNGGNGLTSPVIDTRFVQQLAAYFDVIDNPSSAAIHASMQGSASKVGPWVNVPADLVTSVSVVTIPQVVLEDRARININPFDGNSSLAVFEVWPYPYARLWLLRAAATAVQFAWRIEGK